MVLASVNAIFALVFGGIAWQCIPKGWLFLKLGWRAMDSNANLPDATLNVEKRRALDTANRFLIGGILWLGGGLLSVLLTVVFIVFTLRYVALA